MAENPNGRMEPYVPLYASLLKHRKIFALKRMLNLRTRREAVGIVGTLFLLTLESAWSNGDLGQYAPADLEELLEWDGEAGEMVRALQECGNGSTGFLDGMKVNDWAQINKRLIDGRAGRKLRHDRMRGAPPKPPTRKPHSNGAHNSSDPRARVGTIMRP